ncbi:TerD family protein [Pseudomonas taiwanensis]|uniref:TerD family protein n=1 Tax=Pseudomonas taiwanensis TaxID=470150 RepID=UPI0028DD4779|nr:TerD family protein [Pseudomonas taiwanensis]MDT8924807.1 TerD family protein [Pseudomonas taiwanensis]
MSVINLQKNQRISLEKPDGTKFTTLSMGLAWDGVSGFLGRTSVDLDASCLMLNKDKQLVDQVWYRQLKSQCGSIHHSGDNRTGEGSGDDETIRVNLATVPANVEYLVFTVNSFTGQNFDKVENASCRLYDDKGTEQAKFALSEKGKHTAMIMVSAYRHGDAWKVKAIGHATNCQIASQLMQDVQNVI